MQRLYLHQGHITGKREKGIGFQDPDIGKERAKPGVAFNNAVIIIAIISARQIDGIPDQ